jgi:Ca2+-binding EF-hand superfamily protein
MQPGQKMPAEAQRVDELFETSDGRTLFKKIGDKLMANAKGGKLREQFRKFDLDGNGSVDYDELRTGLAQMNYGLTDEQFRMLCKAVDKDGGGEIDYDEFMESFDAWQPLGERNDARSDNIMTAAPWELVHGDWEIMKAKASSEEVEKAVNDAAADSEIVRKDGRFVHSAIVNKLNQKHETMRKIFVNFDRDQSGDLDPEELREGLKYAYLNLDPVQIGKFVAYADRDGGGTIDIDEFMAHFATPDYGHPQGFITQGGGMRMNRVPLDPSQQVKMDELERLGAALRETSYQAPSRVIRAFTANDYHADGRVSVHELRDILHTLRPDLSSEQVHSLLPDAKTQDNKMRFVNYKQLLSHASDAPHPLGSIATAPKMLRRPDETISSLRATSTRLSLSSNQSVAEAMQRGRYSNTPDWDAARGSKDTFNLTQPAVGTASYGAPTEMMTTNKLRQLQMLQANDKHRKTRRWGRLRGTEARRMHNKTHNSVDLMSQSPRHVDDDLIDMKLESRVGGRKKARRQYTEHVRLFGGMEAMIKDFMRNGLVAPDGSFKEKFPSFKFADLVVKLQGQMNLLRHCIVFRMCGFHGPCSVSAHADSECQCYISSIFIPTKH